MKRDEAIVKLRAARKELLEAFAGIAEEDMTRPNAVGKWSLKDLSVREIALLALLVVFIIAVGVYPRLFLDPMQTSISNLLSHSVAGLIK